MTQPRKSVTVELTDHEVIGLIEAVVFADHNIYGATKQWAESGAMKLVDVASRGWTGDFFDYQRDVAAVNAAHDVLLANRIDNFTLAQEVARAVIKAVQQ